MSLIFTPEDLFPLLPSIEGTYEVAKVHSAQVDQWLGYEIIETEALIQDQRLPWIGLAPETLLTPYTEIRFLLSKLGLETGMRVIELGAAYARMAQVIFCHYPGVSYCGIEMVEPRFREARRVLSLHGVPLEWLECSDVLAEDRPLPEGDVYFLYDLSSNLQDTERMVKKIKEKAKSHPVTVVGRGRATRSVIERHHPWLSAVKTPAHFGNFSVYRS